MVELLTSREFEFALPVSAEIGTASAEIGTALLSATLLPSYTKCLGDSFLRPSPRKIELDRLKRASEVYRH